MRFHLYIFQLLFFSALVDLILSEANSNNIPLDIKRVICVAQAEALCAPICEQVTNTEMKIKIMSTQNENESCKHTVVPEYIPWESTYTKILYQLFVEENQVTRDIIYAYEEQNITGKLQKQNDSLESLNSQEEISREVSKEISKESVDVEEVLTRKLDYIENMEDILGHLEMEGNIFVYDLQKSSNNNEKKKFASKTTSSIMFRKNFSLVADFYTMFETNFDFVPATEVIDEDAYNAWMEIEVKIKSLIENDDEDTEESNLLTVVEVMAKSKDSKSGSRIIMKQIISNKGTMVFIIPKYSHVKPFENTKRICENLCTQYGFYFDNQLLTCCDPRAYKRFRTKNKTLLKGANLKFNPLLVYEFRGQVKLVTKSKKTHKWLGKFHYFCNEDFRKHIQNTKRSVIILQRVTKNTLCASQITNALLKDDSFTIGIIIDLIKKLEKTEADMNDAEELEYIPNLNETDLRFHAGQQIFKNKPNLLFFKLSEVVVANENVISWSYKMMPKYSLQRTDSMASSNQVFFTDSTNCLLFRKPALSLNNVFSKENVIEKFKSAIKNVNKATVEKYLQHLWSTRYVRAIPYNSYENMTFEGSESITSCAILPMWTGIYKNHREAVVEMTRKIIAKVNEEALIYEFQYQLLRFKHDHKPFRLHENKQELETLSFFHYIVKIIMTPKGQIAFATVNDVFLLLEGLESPFRDDNQFLNNFCNLNCDELGYGEIIIQKGINYCCEVTNKLLEIPTNQSNILDLYIKKKKTKGPVKLIFKKFE